MKTKNIFASVMLGAILLLSTNAWCYTTKDVSQAYIALQRVNVQLNDCMRNRFCSQSKQQLSALRDCSRQAQAYHENLRKTVVGLIPNPGPQPRCVRY